MGMIGKLIASARRGRQPAGGARALRSLLDVAETADREGHLDAACAAYRQALDLAPDNPGVHVNFGALAKRMGDHASALASFTRAATLLPSLVHAWYNLGLLHYESWQLAEAERALWQALSHISPGIDGKLVASVISMQALTLQSSGQPGKARAFLDEAAGRFPEHADNCMRLTLLGLSADPTVDADELLARHRAWAGRFADPITAQVLPREPDRSPHRLRIGYVSGDFCEHAVARFAEPLLEAHNRDRFEIFCYDNSPVTDDTTARLRRLADHWRSIVALSDDDAAALVKHDCIDILVDLSGHTAHNRLSLFARKPAPLQLTYLGYPATTGMQAFDYRVTDAFADPPPLADTWYSESLLRLPRGQWCYRPPGGAIAAGVFPAVSGRISFGVFNRFDKITEQMIALWAGILAATPQSGLVIRGVPGLELRERLTNRLAQAGCAPERVTLLGRVPHDQYWASYQTADIALDTYPYNGVTTTCESLWMGIPVVTLAGRFGASRCAASLLTTAGLPELVASTGEDYVRIAVDLAHDTARLRTLRQSMRERMHRSPLMDAAGFTAAFEDAILRAWKGRTGT